MDTNTVLLLVAGLLAPSVNSLLKQPAWNTRVNFVVSALTAVGLGGAATALNGGLDAHELVQGALAVFALGQAVYHMVQKHTLFNKVLERLMVWKKAQDA